MRVTTLGTLAVDGVTVAGERLATTLRVLLDAHGRRVSSSALIDAVWGVDVPRHAPGAVQALVSRLRRLGLPVVGEAGGYRLPLDDISTDADQVTALLQSARERLRAGDATSARSHADAARALLPPAPDMNDPNVRTLLRDVATTRAEAAIAKAGAGDGGDGHDSGGDDSGDEADLRMLVDATPPDEAAAALLIRLLTARGRQAQALELAEALRRRLRERYGSDPAPVLAAAHVALLRGELSRPTPAGASPAHALPPGWRRAATPLHGRDEELSALAAQAASAALVTIVGPGGAGKTRLAAEIARHSVAAHEPVRVVELAGIRSPDEVAGAIAAGLRGNDPLRGAAAEAQLWPELTGLVVLDNCEHVLEAAARSAAQILAAAPRAKVLATSRAPLGLPGEVVFRLGALSDDAAMALLSERARAGGATLDWPPGHARELCQRLDNLPLALELAAAWLRHMPIDDVLAGLADRSGLREPVLRELPERHASLWSLVDWSHDLLPVPVRRLWWRLSVIPAAFPAELARSVAEPSTVRTGLAALVEHSLLSLGPGEDGAPRYRMLETVREYGEAQLDAARERAAAMAGLVGWAAELSRQVAPDLAGPGLVAALRRCAADADNLLAGLRGALHCGDDPSSVDTARVLFQLWTIQGRHRDVLDWSARLLRLDDPAARRRSAIVNGSAANGELPDADRLAWTLAFVGVNAQVAGPGNNRLAAGCRRALRRLFAERGQLVSPRATALARVPAQVDISDPEAAFDAAERMINDPDPLVQGFGLFLRAVVCENQGEDDAALTANLLAYHRFEAVGDEWTMGLAAQGMAARLAAAGLPGAEVWLRRGAAHLSLVGATEDARTMQIQLDAQLALDGDEPALARLVEAAADESEPMTAALAWAARGAVALRYSGPEEAVAAADAIARITDDWDPVLDQTQVVMRSTAAVLRLWACATSESDRFAAAQLRLAEDPALSAGDMPALGVWALAGAELAAHRGRVESARELRALAVRLGSRVVLPFQEGYRPPLSEAIGGDAERERAVASWRSQPVPVAVARARDLMRALLA